MVFVPFVCKSSNLNCEHHKQCNRHDRYLLIEDSFATGKQNYQTVAMYILLQ
jgi:hypothetical protein